MFPSKREYEFAFVEFTKFKIMLDIFGEKEELQESLADITEGWGYIAVIVIVACVPNCGGLE